MVTDDDASAPRELKQVQNIKYVQSRTNNAKKCNITDDVQNALNMIHDNPSV